MKLKYLLYITPFTKCINKINNTGIDNAQDIEL